MKIRTFVVAALALVWASPVLAQIKVSEGTEFSIRLDEAVSSNTSTEGDRFTVTLDDDVKLSDGTILKAGYHGVGEVVEAQKNGMLAKTGKLNIRLVYLRVGDDRIRLRANKGAEGDVRVGSTVAAVIFLWPIAPFIKGTQVSIKKGTILRAYADQDIALTTPLPPPPPETPQ
ncbi:hypothetical protein [Phenylobacterium sp.]|uniref:hypothetical protein n=1 Tax=Phenylobacterium sp. TaxID=1871053 RepID=UPI002BC213CD|nr:hypothetical protein [Phenylobacterium sp.]HLZ76009.1 hypothetical protein [Phenylobacterium sp.]